MVASRRALLFASVAALFCVGVAAAGTVRPVIVVVQRIGPVRIEEPKAQIKRALGHGTSLRLHGTSIVRGNHGLHVWFYPKAGLYVSYPSNRQFRPRAFLVMTRSPQYKTSAGIGVGSSLKQLHRAVRVDCGADGKKWIVCTHGFVLPSHTAMQFFLNRATRRVAVIRLDGEIQERRPYTPSP